MPDSFLKHLLENLPNLLVRFDVDGRLTFVNHAWEAATGFVASEVVGKTPEAVSGTAPSLASTWRDALREVLTTARASTVCFTWTNAGGASLQLEYVLQPELSAEGAVLGIVAIGRDLTAERRREADLRKLSVAVEQSPTAVVITGISGLIEYVNPKFSEITGYSREEIMGKTFRLLKSDSMPAETYAALWHTITRGEQWTGELHNHRKNGELYWERATIGPIFDADGSISNFVAIKEDISREKVLEQQFVQAQKLESVGRLAAGVAHDFNNILSVIMSCAEIARRPGDAAERDACMKDVFDAATRGATLTRQLLAFSRRQVLQPRRVDINRILADLEKIIERMVGVDVRVGLDLAPNELHVVVDVGQIEQVIMNLVVNSRDAMPNGGLLKLSTRDMGREAMISVEDTGTGIAPDVLPHIFDPFFTTKEAGKGTGLGLSTVDGVVRQSGGRVAVRSRVAVGTTVEIHLPLAAEHESPIIETDSAPSRSLSGGETVLIVECDQTLLRLLVVILETGGYRVLSAASSQLAAEISGRHVGPIMLLIADMVLPDGTGRDLAARLRDQRREMRVLLMSGGGEPLIAATQSFDATIISKPFVPDVLLLAVRETLDRSK